MVKAYVEPTLTFAEFSEEIGVLWTEALRVFSNVQTPIEERTRVEWEELLEMLKNKPTQ